jgi:hypothetical protein
MAWQGNPTFFFFLSVRFFFFSVVTEIREFGGGDCEGDRRDTTPSLNKI